jgi:precorrin-2/cobalt-factor-2 C20-methyltransferase
VKTGTLYGIGVGPGDPEWITVKAAGILGECHYVFAPKPPDAGESLALQIARRYLHEHAEIRELAFPMSADEALVSESWRQAAAQVCNVLDQGHDCCFLTLGDPLLYSTYIYLLRELRWLRADLKAVTVPGVTAFSAAAALAGVPVGCGKQLVTIVPVPDDLEQLSAILDRGGTVILMKIGNRLESVLKLLSSKRLPAVFVSHAGLPQQRVETGIGWMYDWQKDAGYLSLIIVQASERPA